VRRSRAAMQSSMGGVSLCVPASGPEAEHVDPAIEARHHRYDVGGIRVWWPYQLDPEQAAVRLALVQLARPAGLSPMRRC
jgi:hypothetical protein